jgi:hypothetical protein
MKGLHLAAVFEDPGISAGADRHAGYGLVYEGGATHVRCWTQRPITWPAEIYRRGSARVRQSSFRIVPRPRFLVNSELLLLPNRSG